MDAHGYPCGPSGDGNFERGQVSGVDNCWLELPEEAVKFRVNPECVTGAFIQADEVDVGTVNPLLEFRDFGKGNDGVAIGLYRHVIDQIDDAILKTAGVETVHDMDDQRACVIHLRWVSARAN
jgi:hypothetical protein